MFRYDLFHKLCGRWLNDKHRYRYAPLKHNPLKKLEERPSIKRLKRYPLCIKTMQKLYKNSLNYFTDANTLGSGLCPEPPQRGWFF